MLERSLHRFFVGRKRLLTLIRLPVDQRCCATRFAWHSLEEAVALWRVTSQNELFRFLGVTNFRHFLRLRTLGFWLWRFFALSFATVRGKA